MSEQTKSGEQERGPNEIDLLRGAILNAYERLGLSVIDCFKITPRNPELSELTIQRKDALVTVNVDTDSRSFVSRDDLDITHSTQHVFYLYLDGGAQINTHGRIHTTHPSNRDLKMEHKFHRDGDQLRLKPHEPLEREQAMLAAQLAAEIAGLTLDQIVKDSIKCNESHIYFRDQDFESVAEIIAFIKQAHEQQAAFTEPLVIKHEGYEADLQQRAEKFEEDFYGNPVTLEQITEDPALRALLEYMLQAKAELIAKLGLDDDPGYGLYFTADHPLFSGFHFETRADNKKLFLISFRLHEPLSGSFPPDLPFDPISSYRIAASRQTTLVISPEGLKLGAYDELLMTNRWGKDKPDQAELGDWDEDTISLESIESVPPRILGLLYEGIHMMKRAKKEDWLEDETYQ